MKLPRLPLLALLLCLAAAARAASATNEPVWEIESPRGEVIYDAKSGIATVTKVLAGHVDNRVAGVSFELVSPSDSGTCQRLRLVA